MTSSEAAHFGSDSSWGLGLHQLPVVHHSDGEAKESLLVLESNISGQKNNGCPNTVYFEDFTPFRTLQVCKFDPVCMVRNRISISWK